MLDVVVEKAYPLAYMEFVEVQGRKVQEGPRLERDEVEAQDAWRGRFVF